MLLPLFTALVLHNRSDFPFAVNVKPDFDTVKSHARREAAQRKASGEATKTGVYLGEEGAQSRFRIGFGALIFISFNRLAASLDGSVTCQTRPLGLDNSAS